MTSYRPEDYVVTLTRGMTADTQGNRIQLSGLSDSATAVNASDVDLTTNIREGLGGLLEVTLRGSFGGNITFELMHSSPDVEWFINASNEMALPRGRVRIYGSIMIVPTGYVVNLRNGTLITARLVPNAGSEGVSVQPFTVRFQQIAPSTADFRPEEG